MFGEIFDERPVLRQRLVASEEGKEAFFLLFLVFAGDELFGCGEILRGEFALCLVKAFDKGLVLFEELVIAFGNGAGNDKWRTGVVDEHGVDLVDDGVVVTALYEVAGTHRHVVAQVIEAELVVRAERDVGLVGTASGFGVRLVLVDAVDAEAVEHVERSHPLGVAFSQVVVDCDDVDSVAGKCIEEHGERGDEGLSFTGGHLGDLSLVEDHAAEELDVVVDHVPFKVVSAGHPVVLVDSLVAFDAHEVVLGGQFTVEVVGGHYDLFVFGKAACCVLDDGERVRQGLVECNFVAFEHFLFELVDLVEDNLAVFDGSVLHFGLQCCDFFFEVVR